MSRGSQLAARVGLAALYIAALIIPGYVYINRIQPSLDPILLFPLFGLYAFTLVAWQVLIATNLRWLGRVWPGIVSFHRAQGTFALVLALTHPLLIVASHGIVATLLYRFVPPSQIAYVLLGEAGLVIMIATVVTAILNWSGRRLSWWYKLHRLNYVMFGLVWLHSWLLGADVMPTGLRYLWAAYLTAVVISVAAKYRQPLTAFITRQGKQGQSQGRPAHNVRRLAARR